MGGWCPPSRLGSRQCDEGLGDHVLLGAHMHVVVKLNTDARLDSDAHHMKESKVNSKLT